MRQGNGTDLLGANDPRAASIGVIYVAPNDDRTSVLAAILTQEKLGRKQVAVVLPTPNKAFQRPVDFDDLKAVRRKLQVDVIFIAPPGPGPAEFARQRRFPVYSSLENYAEALREQDGPLADSVGNEKKGFWPFGRGRGSAAPVAGVGTPMPDLEEEEDGDFYDVDLDEEEDVRPPQQSYGARAGRHAEPDQGPFLDEEEDEHVGPNLAAGAAGAAGGFALGELARQQPQRPASMGSGGATQGIHLDSDEDDAFQLPSVQPVEPAGSPIPMRSGTSVSTPASVSQTPSEAEEDDQQSGVAAAGAGAAAGAVAAEPGIIEFLPRKGPRNTLPLPDHMRRGNNAAGAFGAGAAGGAIGVAAASGSSVMRTPPPPVAPPPARAVPLGRGPRRSRRVSWLLVPLLLLITALLVCTSIALAYPAVFKTFVPKNISLPGSPPRATVSITPASQIVSNSYIIIGVTGTPDPKQQTIKARNLTSSAQSVALPVTASGHQQTTGKRATGILTFSSVSPQALTIGRTTFHVNGIAFTMNTNVFLAAFDGNNLSKATVTATADAVGTTGNIALAAINQTCCVSGVSVRNDSAFVGGVDPANYNFVTQADVNAAATQAVQDQVAQKAANQIKSQLTAGEVFAEQPQCNSRTTSSNAVGDTGQNVDGTSVTVTENCSSVSYDDQGMRTLVTNLLAQKAQISPGTGYVLQDNRVIISPIVQSTDPVSLNVSAKGQWVYQFSTQQQQDLLNLIKGKTVDAARTALLSAKGVANATIQYSGTTLPTDLGQMTFNTEMPAPLPGATSGGAGASPTVTSNGTPLAGPGTPTTGYGRG